MEAVVPKKRRRIRWFWYPIGLILFLVITATLTAGKSVPQEQTTVVYCSKCGEELSRSTKTVIVPKAELDKFKSLVENRTGACNIPKQLTTSFYCRTCKAKLHEVTETVMLCKGEETAFKATAEIRDINCDACTATATYNSDKTHPTYAQVEKNPTAYLFRVVKWSGKAFSVQETGGVTAFQVMTDNYDVFVAVYPGTISWLVNDVRVTVLGYVAGTYTGKNAFGATIVQPKIDAVKVSR